MGNLNSFIGILVTAILAFIYGFYMGRDISIKKFLKPTCGMSITHDQKGKIESITYYYTEEAYHSKEIEMKMKYGDYNDE